LKVAEELELEDESDDLYVEPSEEDLGNAAVVVEQDVMAEQSRGMFILMVLCEFSPEQ
jgi:hypothetical protein